MCILKYLEIKRKICPILNYITDENDANDNIVIWLSTSQL